MSIRGTSRSTRRSSVRGNGSKSSAKRNLLSAFEGVCGAITRSIAPQRQSRALFENLEARQLLAATLTPGQYALLDSTTTNGGVAYLAAGSTGVTDIKLTTVNNGVSAGNDQLTAIVVDLAAAGPYNVNIQLANIAGSTPNITFVGGAADTPVNLAVYNTNVADSAGGGFGQLTGAAGTATVAVADSNTTILPAGMTDGVTLLAAGNIGNVDLTTSAIATNRGGSITLLNSAGNIGVLTLQPVDLTNGTAVNLVVDSRATSASSANGGVVVNGAVNLGGAGNHGMTVTTEANSTVANAGAPVTINGSVTTGNATNFGNLLITTPNNVSLGAVTITGTTTVAGGIYNVFIHPTGTANIGQVTVGDITTTGASVPEFVIGAFPSLTTTFTGGISIGNITAKNTGGGGGVAIEAAAITGTVSVASFTETNSSTTPELNTGVFVANVTGDLGGFSMGNVILGDAADVIPDSGSIQVNVGGSSGAVSFGQVTSNGTGIVSYNGDTGGTGKATASVSVTGVTLNRTGGFFINTGANVADDITGALSVGPIVINDGGSFSVTTGGKVGGATTIGNVTAQGAGTQSGNVVFNIGGTAQGVSVGSIALGDASGADSSDFSFRTGTVTADSGMGALAVAGISLNGSGGTSVTIDTNGKGAIAGVTLGDVSIAGSSANNVSIGHNTGVNAAANLGNLSLSGVAISGAGSLSIQGQQIGNVAINGLWRLTGSGNVNITATDASAGATDATRNGQFGNIGGASWDVDFGSAAGFIRFTADDGAGNVLINSVDHYDPGIGGIQIVANADGGSEIGTTADNARVGSIGNITISNPGNNSVGAPAGTWKNVEWGLQSFVAALSGGDINMAGGAEGAFVASVHGFGYGPSAAATAATANTGGAGTWGHITLAGQSNGLFVAADDGITDLTINLPPAAAQVTSGSGFTLFSTATSIVVNGNADNGLEIGAANNVGTAGPVHVVGASGQLSLSGTISGVAVSNVTLDTGDLNLNITAGPTAASDLDRLALNAAGTSSIGNVLVSQGSILGGSYISDSNIGTITAAGSITLATVRSDATANLVTAPTSWNGTIGAITSGGTLSITTLRTRDAADTTFRATQSVGAINARNRITISSAIIGGNLPTITVTRFGTVSTGFVTLPNLDVNGSVDVITGGLLPADTVTAVGTIRGDLNRINAGPAIASVNLSVLAATRSTATTPIFVVTEGDGINQGSGVDSIFLLTGTWNAGTTPAEAPRANLSISFAGGINGTNVATVNDFFGVTTSSSSIFTLATRMNAANAVKDYATNGLGLKDTAVPFSLGGFQSTYGGPGSDKGRNSFKQILIEGNLLGAMGGPGNMSSLANAAAMLASNAPLMGHIANLEITGNWANAAVDNNNAANRIFATQLEELSLGSVTTLKEAGVDGSFSYIAPNAASPSAGVPNNSVAGAGKWLDLELFTALAAPSGTQVVVVPIGDGIIKKFVGPTNQFETIRFTSNNSDDNVVDTAILTMTGGVITQINLFGQSIGILFNTLDAGNPATNSSTNIFYGVPFTDPNTSTVYAATTVTDDDDKAIQYLLFSSSIGNVTVVDTNATDGLPTSVGPIIVGYDINTNDTSFFPWSWDYLNNPNISGENATIRFAGANPVYGSLGNVMVDGSLGLVATSGGVGSITTVQLAPVAPGAVPTSDFQGLVTDGSAGAINIRGSVWSSLAVGDPTVTGGTAALPLVGIHGTPGFGGNITVAADLGMWAMPIGTGYVNSMTSGIQAPVSSCFGVGVIASTATQAGILANIDNAYSGNQVSAPFGISLGSSPIVITVGRDTYASIVSGKGILVTGVKGANDSINAQFTSGDIYGNVWSGNQINGWIKAVGFTGDQANHAPIDNINHPGVISSSSWNFGPSGGSDPLQAAFVFGNNPITILAAGDINAPITAADDIVDILIQAGTGLGGSLLANVVAGLSGSGGIYGTNNIVADNNVGTPGFTTVISAAEDVNFNSIMAGQMPLIHVVGTPFGNINSNIVAGTQPVGATLPLPVTTHFNDATMPILSNTDSSIWIGTLQAGLGGTANVYNLNGTIEAAGSIDIEGLVIDGNAIGNDGQAGGHVASAGVGYLSATFSNPNLLEIDGGTVTGTLSGKLSAGMFVPFNDAGPSPLNRNDLGQLQAGTVLTLGAVNVDLTVGRWVDTPIALTDVLSGAVSSANAHYIPQFSVGATHNVYLDIYAQGQPFAAPQTGPGSVTPNPADGDIVGVSIAAFGALEGYVGAADSASVTMAMSNIDAVTALDTQQNGNPSNPSTNLPLNDGVSNVNVGLSGIGINNDLSITAYGADVGGLNLGFYTAGLDIFTEMNTGGVPTAAIKPATSLATAPFNGDTYWTSWGMGSIIASQESSGGGDFASPFVMGGGPSLQAFDADPTDGLEAGKLTFAMIAAGQDNYAQVLASDDITAVTDSATTDGTPGFSTQMGLNADIAAGLSANRNLDPTAQSDLFPGGNLGASIVAGGDIMHTATGEESNLVGIVAKGGNKGFAVEGSANDTGKITCSFVLVSGAEDQIIDQNNAGAAADPGDIHALVIASSSISRNALIDAGDVFGDFGGIGGATYSSGLPNGSFFGGVIAGAGLDLNISDAVDNDVKGDMNATIRTAANLDVTGYGILAEDDMKDASIEVGYGLDRGPNQGAGDLLGNVVAEGNIGNIDVWGNVGAAGATSVIYSGGVIKNFVVGNPAFGDGEMRPASQYIGSFGTLYSDVFEGGNGHGTAMISIGGGLAQGTVLALGALNGVHNVDLDLKAGHALYHSDALFALFLNAGTLSDNNAAAPSAGDVNIVMFAGPCSEGNSASMDVTGWGNAVSIHSLISGATLDSLYVQDGSVGQITVNNDLNISNIVYGANGYLADLNVPYSAFATTFPFLANSIPTTSDLVGGFNNDPELVNLGNVEVDYNIGDINVQGAITGTIMSDTGSIGNVVANSVDCANFSAQVDVGNIYAATGGFSEDGSITAATGSMGVLNVQGNIDISEGTDRFVVADSIGGLVSRNGTIADLDDDGDGQIFVHGSIGPIVASEDIIGSFTAETGNIGKVVNSETDAPTPQLGIYSDVGDITVNLAAGNCIGDITAALGSVIGDVTQSQILLTLNGVAINSMLGVDAGISTGGYESSGFNLNVDLDKITATGTLGINVNSQTFIRAAGDIGQISAYRDIGFYNITAGGSIAGFDTTVGAVGAAIPLTLNLGGLSAGIKVGDLKVTAHNGIGWDHAAIDSAKDIGEAAAIDLSFNGLRIQGSPAGVNLHAVTGDIGDIIGRQGIAVLSATAGGSIGDVKAMTGDIGSAANPVVLKANGGVEIDPNTLEYVAVGPNGNKGIGNVYSYLGDIYIDLATAGDVGIAGLVGTATGGIAAPLGSINGTIKVGGDLGGLSAQSVNVDKVVLGTTGVLRNPSGGQVTVASGNALKFSEGGVMYSVQTTNGNATVDYTVTDGNVVFNSINVSSTGGPVGVWVLTSAMTSGPIDGSTSSAQVEVKSLTIAGDAANISVDGTVDTLTVSGNLDGGSEEGNGSLRIEGQLGDATVGGNIGHTGNADDNAFVADGMDVQIGGGGFGSLVAGGTNYGLVTADIGKVSGKTYFIAWENSLRLDTSSNSDKYITASLKSGTAKLVVNNGFLETVTFSGSSASTFGVVSSDTSFGAATDGSTTQAGSKANSSNEKALANEIKGGARSGSANVGTIGASTAKKFTLTNGVIEGKVDTLAFAGAGSAVKTFSAGGDVGSMMAAGSINGVNLLGDVGTINGGTSLQNVQVRGNADVLVASSTVKNINVHGNAGVIRSGKTMSNVNVGGSAVSISAQNANKVSVAGSVGVETSGVLTGSGLSLGAAFSSADVARILGTTEAGLDANGNSGANGTSYLGGFFVGTGNNIAVGGAISDLEALTLNNGKWTMLGQVVDDAQVGRGSVAYVKLNGVVIKSPAQRV